MRVRGGLGVAWMPAKAAAVGGDVVRGRTAGAFVAVAVEKVGRAELVRLGWLMLVI
jgi:hypothetical protein